MPKFMGNVKQALQHGISQGVRVSVARNLVFRYVLCFSYINIQLLRHARHLLAEGHLRLKEKSIPPTLSLGLRSDNWDLLGLGSHELAVEPGIGSLHFSTSDSDMGDRGHLDMVATAVFDGSLRAG